jgi:hypothetical protein
VSEAVEACALVLDDVEEGAPVELHVGEVLEQDVDRVDSETLELLAGQSCSMHARELVELVTHDDTEVLEAHPVDALVHRRDELDA